MSKQSRNLGIDTLRIISMIGVVFLHILGHGGILTSSLSPATFSIVWFFELLAYPAVNCFVLISGYIGYRGDKVFPKIKNILSLLFTVLFYSISITAIFLLCGPKPLGLKELIQGFLPTTMGSYWFFTAYFGLFLLSPLLNVWVSNSTLKQDLLFLIVLLLFSTVSILRDTFTLGNGYSVIWLVFMYLLGAMIKKHEFNKLFSKKIWCIVALSAFAVTWLSKMVLHFSNISFLQSHNSVLIRYTSPTIVLMAVGLLCLFANLNCSKEKTISFFASSAFSVYLIHDHFLIRNHLMPHISSIIGGLNFVFFTLSIIGIGLGIFISCILIDKVRICLFRILKIDALCACIEAFVKRVINLVCEKVRNIL